MISSTINNCFGLLIVVLIMVCIGCSSSEETEVMRPEIEFQPKCCIIDNDFPFGDDEEGTVIFGLFFGLCGGDFAEQCIETYMLRGEILYEDIVDSYVHDSLEFHCLPDSLFTLAAHIRDIIPSELLASDVPTEFGCPDCLDQGGMYLRLLEQDKEFLIDLDKPEIPEYLHNLVDMTLDLIENVLP